ncbi:Ni2+-binding GTPase, involved in maturation of urease and hydrogenase HypB [Methanonatronarchaeum thermophilum]|uniref:Ni2+-binding GTPase, involved in maturation of urease and hydrogenase HypB n=1 Tax=Methanonatronarchaeum thermophilum TaxID=1927129 RepID=A0A1Y3GDV7_9EURY|nr:hydrogenase nickel incorporation protein HypB [Methanonatronarchaeum thermophilum]OUJ19407.1 Ni2+-binding GTPase, involved in maturation of urease and hydrogenase HypB [Methanonatronarchaeum thermophilum]
MHDYQKIDVGSNLIEENDKEALEVSRVLDDNGVRSFDLVGAIGSGKTSIVEEYGSRLSGVGAVVGDVSGDDDYQRLKEIGIPVVNLNTGRECHLDAHLVKHAISDLPLSDLDYLFFENVGNLVCPTDFKLGAEHRIVVVSVTEGDDVVNKHPMILKTSDLLIINKIDIADAVDADVDRMLDDARSINSNLDVIKLSMKEGVGIEYLDEFIIK